MCSSKDTVASDWNHGFISQSSGPTNLFRLCLLSCFLFPAIGSLSLKPPAEEILNRHLCPNPVLSATSKLFPSELSKILPLRLQPRTGTNLYSSRLIRPCSFVEDPTLSSSPSPAHSILSAITGVKNVTQIRIQSINLNTSPWNFSTASSECSKFMMFRSWSEYGNGYPVMCGRENFDQFLGPYGHPMILYYHLRDEGMSFPLFHPNYSPTSQSSSSIGNSRKDLPRSIFELKYMLIYYTLRSPDGAWTCRLQQYKLNPMQEACPISSSPTLSSSTICGEYPCAVLDALYSRKMGGGTGDNTDFQQQRFILVKSKNQEKYRVRNFLRQKFVPIIFLVMLICAYKTYMKAGLRLHGEMPMMPVVSESRLRRYNTQHHHHRFGRDPFRDIYFDSPSDDNNIPAGLHIPYEPSSSGGLRTEPRPGDTGSIPDGPPTSTRGKFMGNPTDPPPSYETLFPPSYNELFYSSPSATEVAVATSTTNTTTATADDAKNPKV